jgi:two-component system, OmpR family, sensor kinase
MAASSGDDQRRLLETLERLLEIRATDLRLALSESADLVASALSADKVDAFLYDSTRDSLVALGSSNQPLTQMQKRLGLDVLPVANRGRSVEVFETGRTYVNGRVDRDTDELRGIRDALEVQSEIGVPLEVAGTRRGMLMVASRKADFFTPDDVRFAESVARWIGMVGHRAELVQEIARNAVEQGRRAVAEELITVFAHDMRNHMTPVRFRLSTLRGRADRAKREADLREIELAQKALERLESLVSDVLDVARIDRGMFHIDAVAVEITALLHDCASTLSTPDHPVNVKAVEELLVSADPARVRQCIENVLANAVKYSPAHAPVTVTVSRETRGDAEWARIDVLDEGPGVSPELLPRIFDRFVTSDRAEGGLGLGLYLAKRIAVLHGGDLTVESPPGTGARFTLKLPRQR